MPCVGGGREKACEECAALRLACHVTNDPCAPAQNAQALDAAKGMLYLQ